jgi:RNA polymerase sigma-70 factor (ECF subfamily)
LKPEEKQKQFMRLYQPCHQQLSNYCRVMTGNMENGKDLMGETIMAAFENFDRLKKTDSFLFFLLGIAKRIYLNSNRRQKFKGEYNPQKVAQIEDESAHPNKKMDATLLYELLEKLPMAQKEALVLFEINGFHLQEVADLQKSSLSAVKSRLARGRQKLAELLQKEEKIINNLKES